MIPIRHIGLALLMAREHGLTRNLFPQYHYQSRGKWRTHTRDDSWAYRKRAMRRHNRKYRAKKQKKHTRAVGSKAKFM